MQKFIDWLTNVLAPKAQKFFNKPYIAGVSSAMTKVLPFILAGSIVYVYGVFQGFFPTVLPNLTFLLIFSFRMLGLITSFYVGHQIMEKLEMPQYSIIAGITSILMFIMFIKPEMEGIATATFQFGRFGPTGMFVSIAAGVLVALVFHLIGKLHILEDNDTVPVFIQEWIRNTIPVFLSVCVGYTLSYGLNLDVYQIIMNLFAPISNFLQSFPGFVLLAFLQSFFFTLGISPWVWGAVRTPVFAAGIAANIEAVAAGLAPQYIVTYEVMFTIGLLTLGGQGSPLPLVVMMLRSKSKKLRQFARVTVGPAIFNISEPIMYGLPIVFNPIMMIPMWINPIVGSCLLWVIFRTGLLKIPAISLQTGSLPAPITTVMICQDWRGILWWVVFFVIYAVIWYPFYKAYERQVLAEEAENN
ncbi:MAG: PTS sugar transporter subunit IIC [Erysipelotrichaceae bacterium]|nr:PTS sugar transporter subunit IIC [Erysipelotrichaceae bacterium]